MSDSRAARRRRGGLVARILSGAWRHTPPPLELADLEWREAEPILLATGAGGLAWARVRGTPRERAVGGALHQAYRYQTVTVLARGCRIASVMQRLRAAGLEAVVGKGWAAARLYPEPGRRPGGDIDLYVRRRDHAAAARVLRAQPRELVDLHDGFADLDDRDEDELLARSRLIGEGPDAVRVFGAEDHLRLMVLHALRHRLRRPVWLCDVACAVESAPPGFDWDWFAAGSGRRTEWALVGLDVARAVLGAQLDGAPASRRPSLSERVAPRVLEAWGAPRARPPARPPVAARAATPPS
jgi:hypothetical protein